MDRKNPRPVGRGSFIADWAGLLGHVDDDAVTHGAAGSPHGRPRGGPFGFPCPGRRIRPCAKVFACGKNACTALLRRPALRGPGGRTHGRKNPRPTGRGFFIADWAGLLGHVDDDAVTHGAAGSPHGRPRGGPFGFPCPGRRIRPCAKVFAAGENACTALARRPAVRGLGGPHKKAPARWAGALGAVSVDYSATSMTTPEPTVRPPSRMAKRRPFSMAMGVISSTFMSTLSPGMHISVPSGRVMTPVTSVVRK